MGLEFMDQGSVTITDTYFYELGMAVDADSVFLDIFGVTVIRYFIEIPDSGVRVMDEAGQAE